MCPYIGRKTVVTLFNTLDWSDSELSENYETRSKDASFCIRGVQSLIIVNTIDIILFLDPSKPPHIEVYHSCHYLSHTCLSAQCFSC